MAIKLNAVQVELTNNCVLDCAECPRRFMSRKVGNMSLDLIKEVIMGAVELNPSVGFNLNGIGEPLLYPKLPEVVDFLDEMKVQHIDFFSSLVSSTSLLKTAIDSFNRFKGDILFATTKHMYDVNGNLQNQMESRYDENLDIVFNNLHPRHFKNFHINMVLNKYHTKEDVKLFFKKYREKIVTSNVHVTENLNPWLNLVNEMGYEGKTNLGPTESVVCQYPFILLHVVWDGTVLICCTDDVHGNCSLGTIKTKEDVDLIWNGEKMNSIRDLFNDHFSNDKKLVIEPCTKCKDTRWLMGV